MKKIALYATLPVILTMATPIALADSNAFCDGWFAGASIGGAFRNGHGDTNTFLRNVTAAGTDQANTAMQFDLRKNSVLGVLSGGYNYICDEYFGGVEAFLSISDYHRKSPIEALSESRTSISYTNTVDSKLNSLEVGIDLRPGYLLCSDTLLFGRIGVAYNKLSVSASPLITNPSQRLLIRLLEM